MRVGVAFALVIALSGAAFAQQRPATPIRVAINSDIRSTAVGVNRDANTDTVMLHLV